MDNVQRRSTGYQILVVGLLSINFGIVFFDRNSLNFLMPYVQPELQLSNSQIGFIAGAFSFTWALAAFGIGKLCDAVGNRKLLLVLATLLFSLCSFLTGLAQTFVLLLGARVLMGVAEGGVMPISHAMVMAEVPDEHRGLAQGVAQNLGSNLLGSFVAPVLLGALAQAFGWRPAFYLAGLPGILSAALIWFLLREPPAPPAQAAASGPRESPWAVLRNRNVLICCCLSILLVSYLVCCWAFMPLYLAQVRGFSLTTGQWLMGTLGISATIGAFATTALSDRIGRRPVMIAAPFVSVILPLGAMFYTGPVWGMFVVFFVGWALNGIFPLFMATVPSESVPRSQTVTALGFAMGSGEVIGGALTPWVAGAAADGTSLGLAAPLWIMLGLTIVGGIFALFLKETAPRVLARRRGGVQPAITEPGAALT
jgi:predicted MFS family arabinose efflux permease